MGNKLTEMSESIVNLELQNEQQVMAMQSIERSLKGQIDINDTLKGAIDLLIDSVKKNREKLEDLSDRLSVLEQK